MFEYSVLIRGRKVRHLRNPRIIFKLRVVLNRSHGDFAHLPLAYFFCGVRDYVRDFGKVHVVKLRLFNFLNSLGYAFPLADNFSEGFPQTNPINSFEVFVD